MPNFRYAARTKKGELERGLLEARNEDELIDILQARELIVVSFEPVTKIQPLKEKTKRRFHKRIKLDDMIIFAKQLTTLINAGITLLRSLEITSTQTTSKRLYDVLEEVKKDVSGGSSLKDATAKHPKIFSKFWVNVVEAGETSGQLGFALEQLTQYLEGTAAFRRKIVNALVYPAIILFVAIIAILVFIIRIIPIFENVYSSVGAELPVFTQIIFNITGAIRKGLLFEIGVIVLAILSLRSYRSTPVGRRNIDRFLLQLPLIGEIIRQTAAVRFARGLGMLIKSGTPILHAMDIMIESAANVIIMDLLTEVKENIRAGKAMATRMIESHVFPDLLAHMVSVGEESGELANMLEKAALFYQERTDAYVTRLTTMFEPALIVIIGAIVGTLIIAMYLPIFGLAGAVK